jgi:hypothetical protein
LLRSNNGPLTIENFFNFVYSDRIRDVSECEIIKKVDAILGKIMSPQDLEIVYRDFNEVKDIIGNNEVKLLNEMKKVKILINEVSQLRKDNESLKKVYEFLLPE